jgi:hypothetical protein
MKRLINPAPNGGVPYQNSDFNDILQYSSFNGLKQYYEFLCKDLNISSLILNGFKIVGTGSNSIIIDTTDTFVYMNGEILSSPSSGTVSIQSPFYLYENTPTYEQRQLRNTDTKNVIVDRTWTFSTSDPGGNTTYSLGSTNSKLTFNLSSSYIRGYLNSELKGYLRPEIDGTFFGHTTSDTYDGIQTFNNGPFIAGGVTNDIWAKPYRDVSLTWNRPYISYIGSININDVVNPGFQTKYLINIPNQGTNNYVVNGTWVGSSASNNATVVWSVYDKGTTSFGITTREIDSVTQNLSFDFTIVKNPNNGILDSPSFTISF